MNRPVSPASPAAVVPVSITLEALAQEIPDLAPPLSRPRLIWWVYWIGLGGVVGGFLMMGLARLQFGLAPVVGWAGLGVLILGLTVFGGLAATLIGVAIVRLGRLPRLLMKRLDDVYEIEERLIARLVGQDAAALAERGRFAKLQGQSVERSAVVAGVMGVAATQSGSLFSGWEVSGVLLDLAKVFADAPAALAVGACLAAVILAEHARKLSRMARIYEEAATRAG